MELVIKETLEKLLEVLGVSFNSVEVKEEGKGVYFIEIQSENSSLLIGRHGDTVTALQHVLRSLLWNQGVDSSCQVIVDVDGYKKRQEENVIRMAERKADLAISNQRSILLPPMNPYLRRKIHLHLASSDQYKDSITTDSVGQGMRRQVKILPK